MYQMILQDNAIMDNSILNSNIHTGIKLLVRWNRIGGRKIVYIYIYIYIYIAGEPRICINTQHLVGSALCSTYIGF